MKTKLTLAALAALLPLSALACAAHDPAKSASGPETLTLAAMTTPAEAAPAPAGPITVTDAYARSANQQTGAAFMTLTNAGTSACTLRGVTSDVAQRVELHTHKDEGGVMKMVPLDGATVPAGGSHALARGGDHVMFMGLNRPLADGDSVALTLDLGDCGQVPVTVPVDNAAGMATQAGGGQAGAAKAGAAGHAGMDHGQAHGQPSN
ncbi:copper chaperone PCu(A)C [Paracoccus luteus]|uniref:copper chaperone PCu(A)C n=1 Tax=Paracoccus luteus TaxID=2508543 RepID=UPI001FEA9A58|nr:copper chaperone PCu(A)C [Paracoccus luteus]